MPYQSSIIPVDEVRDLMDAQWDTQDGNVPEPRYFVPNDGTEPIRIDLNTGDYVSFEPGIPMERENPIGTWVYGHRIWNVILTLYTKQSRVRLWDLKNEIRRICHARMHLMTNFQRIQYQQFTEMWEEEQNIWKGRVEIQLVSNAVLLEVTNT